MRRPKGKRTLVVAFGHSPDGRFAHRDDRGQYHDAKKQGGRQHAVSMSADVIPHKGHQHDQAKEAVNHRGDARQQLDCRR